MKAILIVCLVSLVSVTLGAPGEGKYTTKYDNTNIDEILENPKIRTNYINCLIDVGPCTAEGRELKSHVEDALKTDCSKCSETQKVNSEKVLCYLENFDPTNLNKLKAKFDPTGEYEKNKKGQLKCHE